VEKLLRVAGFDGEAARVLLLCYPRILGYVFNPLSVYYVLGPDGALTAVLYEVRNTFGEQHTYVVPAPRSDARCDRLRHGLEKAFHVSPFLGMEGRYRFSVTRPERDIRIRISETDRNGPILFAGFKAVREDLGTGTLARAILRVPFLTFQVIAAIHWEATKLWWKGCPVFPHPGRPERRRTRWMPAKDAVDRV
jgi:DUF1365 family protein